MLFFTSLIKSDFNNSIIVLKIFNIKILFGSSSRIKWIAMSIIFTINDGKKIFIK